MQGKGFGEAQVEEFRALLLAYLKYALTKEQTTELLSSNDINNDIHVTDSDLDSPHSNPHSIVPHNTPISKFSSIGRVRTRLARISQLCSIKIVPTCDEKSTALSILSSPDAKCYIDGFNEDLAFENEKVLLMEKVAQHYAPVEDDMVTSALGLVSGMKMKGAIPFKSEFGVSLGAASFNVNSR